MRPPLLLTAMLWAALGTSQLFGQGYPAPPNSKSLDESGVVEQVLEVGLQIKVNNDVWLLRVVDGQTKVEVDGTAEPNYLQPKLCAQFSADVDKKWAVAEPIKDIEIFAAEGKNSLGLFTDASSDKPVRKPEPGSYTVKGKIVSFKDNELTVLASGKKVAGKLSDDVSIKVALNDFRLAQVGDSVKFKSWYLDPQRPQNGRPGQSTATELTVTLSKPLASNKKVKATPTKPSKTPKTAKPEMDKEGGKDGGLVQDLFGVEKDKPKK